MSINDKDIENQISRIGENMSFLENLSLMDKINRPDPTFYGTYTFSCFFLTRKNEKFS